MDYLDKLKEFKLSKELVAETFILSEALANPGIFERCEKDKKDINFLLNKVERHKDVFKVVVDYLIHLAVCNEIAIEEAVEYGTKQTAESSVSKKLTHFQEDPQNTYIKEKQQKFRRFEEKKKEIKKQSKEELYDISDSDWQDFYNCLKSRCGGLFDIKKKEFQREFIEHGCVCVLWRFTDLVHVEQFYRIVMQRRRREQEDVSGENYNKSDSTVQSLTALPVADLFFRGHANYTWRLVPNVFRPFSRDGYTKPVNQVSQVLEDFNIPKLNLYLPYLELKNNLMFKRYIKSCDQEYEDDFNLYEIGQHHGIPTRLLDWSKNLFKALFFACYDAKNLDSNGVVYGFNPDPIFLDNLIGNLCHMPHPIVEQSTERAKENLAKAVFGDSESALHWDTQVPPCIVPNIEPHCSDQRFFGQQGGFTIHNSEFINFLELPFFPALRIVIPYYLKSGLIYVLNKFGINYQTLFPDLDHFALHLRTTSCMTGLMDSFYESENAFYNLDTPLGSFYMSELIHPKQQSADIRENMLKKDKEQQ